MLFIVQVETRSWEDGWEDLHDRPKYIPKEISLPVDETGTVIATHKGKQKEQLAISTHVRVERKRDVQEARMQLPICKMEQEIMEAIYNNDV
jgi:HrpA-like RNA helicase